VVKQDLRARLAVREKLDQKDLAGRQENKDLEASRDLEGLTDQQVLQVLPAQPGRLEKVDLQATLGILDL